LLPASKKDWVKTGFRKWSIGRIEENHINFIILEFEFEIDLIG